MCQGLTTLLLGQRGEAPVTKEKDGAGKGGRSIYPLEVQRSNSLPTSIDFFKIFNQC